MQHPECAQVPGVWLQDVDQLLEAVAAAAQCGSACLYVGVSPAARVAARIWLAAVVCSLVFACTRYLFEWIYGYIIRVGRNKLWWSVNFESSKERRQIPATSRERWLSSTASLAVVEGAD